MSLVYCPKCDSKLEDGECLAPNTGDWSIPAKVCDRCQEAFTPVMDYWDLYEENCRD